jgi:hypothetical protein
VGLMQHMQVDEREVKRRQPASDAITQPRRVTMRRLDDNEGGGGGGGTLCLLQVLRCEEVRFALRFCSFAVQLPVCHS